MSHESIKKKHRLVVTCTTLPDRYDTLLRTLKCVKNQDYIVDAIYVTIPYVAKRLNKTYPDIPKEISDIAKIVRIEQDYGPLTKMYGALYYEKNPNTIIISLDDDCIYPNNLISYLVGLSKKEPNVAICGTGCLMGNGIILSSFYTNVTYLERYNNFIGFKCPENGRYIDLIHGFAGVLYKRSFFPRKSQLYEKLFKYPLLDDNVFCHDDVIISGYLKKNNIKMKTFKNIPSIISDVKNEDALSYNFYYMFKKFKKSVKFLKKHGMFLKFESTTIDENPIMKIILFIIFFVFIIIFIYIICKNF